MFLDPILNSISDLIKEKEVFLVGGYLRNYFLNNEISPDRDLVVLENSKDLALKIAQELDGTFVELDNENEIYRIVLKDKINYFDVSKALENDILKDIQRRDFTINSIFYNLNKKEIFDPLGGLNDLKNKVLKTYSLDNFKDDPLRFLRLFRFYSKLNFKIDDELLNFTKENFSLINNVAKERINQEIIKIFEGEYVSETLLKMYDLGILELVFPFVSEIKKVPKNSHHHLDLIHHSIETVKNIQINKPLLKIAAFYHDIGKPSTWTIEPIGRHRFIGHDVKGAPIAKKELENLKFSNKQIAYITKMIRYHIYPASLINCPDNKKAFARFVKKLDKDTPDIIDLSRADRLSAQGEDVSKEMIDLSLAHLDNLLNYYNEVKNKIENFTFLLDGKEIMKHLNLKPSKKIGEILDKLKEAQLSGEVKTKKEAYLFIEKF